MKIKKDKIGILIPTFNRRHYLKSALDSACSQTHTALEIIVIDNGSTDGTAEFIAGITDPRVRYIVNEQNIGMIGSINKGIRLFSDDAKWCTILSDDDLLDNDCIANLLHTVIATDAKSIVHSHRIFIDQQGNKIREAKLSPREETSFEYLKMRSCSLRETFLTGVFFRRKVFLEIGGYPDFLSGFTTDDAFIFALALKDRLIFEPSSTAFIRIHEEAESLSFTGAEQKIRTINQFSDYCDRAVVNNTAFSYAEKQRFKRILKKYVTTLCSGYWLRNAHYIMDQRNRDFASELSELSGLVIHQPSLFSLRIRIHTMFDQVFGLRPESNRTYRFLWGIIEGCLYRTRKLSRAGCAAFSRQTTRIAEP
jgi:glycosyltransferase involved in cell wall biosynthesis